MIKKAQLPLLTAMLSKGNSVDSIKLLNSAYPNALSAADPDGFLPLHSEEYVLIRVSEDTDLGK